MLGTVNKVPSVTFGAPIKRLGGGCADRAPALFRELLPDSNARPELCPPGRSVTGDGDDWRRRLDERLERLAAETPGLIAEIASLVASLPPDQLLYRAYFEYFIRSQGVRDDTDMGPEQIISMRMIDYVQSVIASVPPAPDQKDELSDRDWETLRGAVERLFTTHIEAFAAVRMRHEAGFQDPEGNLRESFLQSSLVRYWYSVSGKRFPHHFRQHLSDLLSPHSEMLDETFSPLQHRTSSMPWSPSRRHCDSDPQLRSAT